MVKEKARQTAGLFVATQNINRLRIDKAACGVFLCLHKEKGRRNFW